MNTSVLGYVVNMFNPLNYDIALDLPQTFNTADLETSTYTYTEDGYDGIQTGVTYRCRLIGILRRKCITNHEDVQGLTRVLTHKFLRLNGWVLVNIVGFDKYKRLLVELVDFVSGTSINSEIVNNKALYVEYV
jgi:hypothetical protein